MNFILSGIVVFPALMLITTGIMIKFYKSYWLIQDTI